MLPTISNKFTLQALHPLDQRFLEVRGTFYLHIFYSRFLLFHRFSCLDFIFIFTKQILYHFYFVSHSTTASSTVILKRKYPLQTIKSQNYSENYLCHLSSHFHFPIYTQKTISKNTHAFIHCLHHIPQNNSGSTGNDPTKAKNDDCVHHLLKTLHIVTYSLYIFCCIFWWYFHIVYIFLRHRSTKESPALRFTKFLQVFNSHFLMVVVLAKLNIFLGKPLVSNFIEFVQTSENFKQ